ncbi:hypothetical protein [Paenibacillus sp. PK3_47]|uniref:hypothetical protein n=1 Tax=Paenibacillus sp. PK3_47 TaxID=2072642 RepID=UPI00201E06E7|nr:hypothetical protein [Paenibacillus sp. PK3_47]
MMLILCSCGGFDRDTWLTEPEKRDSMVSNLTSQFKLEGMTESEIVDLLGEPDQKLTEPPMQYLYYTGTAGLGVKVALLQLLFDEEGKVESHDTIYK